MERHVFPECYYATSVLTQLLIFIYSLLLSDLEALGLLGDELIVMVVGRHVVIVCE